jgi:TolA-binding protein
MSEFFEELSARARRGELSRPEQERLRIYLKSSLEARLWHEAGTQIDAQDAVLPGDHDAGQRVMLRALSQFPAQRSRWSRRLPAWVLVAAVLLVASVAAASVAGLGYFRERRLLSQRLASAAKPASAVARSTPTPAAPVAAPSSAIVAADALPLAVEPAPSTASVASAARGAPVESAAASLLSAAALARREGNTGKAIALLDSLQDQYPASREARSSDLTLGALHLKRGSPAIALRHFESYSRSSPRGALAPEALWGQYQALSALGRAVEAEARLRLLLQRFPSSTYAGVARAKLQVESTAP